MQFVVASATPEDVIAAIAHHFVVMASTGNAIVCAVGLEVDAFVAELALPVRFVLIAEHLVRHRDSFHRKKRCYFITAPINM